MNIILEFIGSIFSFLDIYLSIVVMVVIVVLLLCFIAHHFIILLPKEIKLSDAIALSKNNPESNWQLDHLFLKGEKQYFLLNVDKSYEGINIVFVNRVTKEIAFLSDSRIRRKYTIHDERSFDKDYTFRIVSCKDPLLDFNVTL